MSEAYKKIENGIDAMKVAGADPSIAKKYVKFINIRAFWNRLSSEMQAEIGCAAIVSRYANFIRGDAYSKYDDLFENLEYQEELILHERVAETGIFDRIGLPVAMGDEGQLYYEWLREVLSQEQPSTAENTN